MENMEYVKEIEAKINDNKTFKYLSFGDFLGNNVKAIYTEAQNFDGRRIVENKIRNESARKIMDELGIKMLYTPNTIHTANAFNIDKFPDEKEGIYRDITGDANEQYMLKFIPWENDAVIGKLKGKPISMQVADCNAIYIYDPKTKAYSLAHSGWKGTLNKIILNTVEKMVEDFNVDPKDLKFVLAPSISKESFSVHSDVYLDFEKMLDEENMDKDKYISKLDENNQKNIDLKAIIKDMLKEKYNIREENILDIKEDTVTKKYENGEYKYHSHRRDLKKAGRNMAIIYIPRD